MSDDHLDVGLEELGRPRKVLGLDLSPAERLRWLEETMSLFASWEASTSEDPPGDSRDKRRSRP